MAHETRIPHSLRLAIFFLRLVLGVNFFYLGWTTLFNRSLAASLHGQTLSNLYAWLARATPIASIPSAVFAWIFLIIGACVILGLFTRLASIVAIALILASWLPTISFSSFNPAQLVNGELIALFSFFILIFGKAGNYFGLDNMLHISMRKKKEV
jgi:uncharacterized membrane protein YphA (DoxX/SURF4 family)